MEERGRGGDDNVDDDAVLSTLSNANVHTLKYLGRPNTMAISARCVVLTLTLVIIIIIYTNIPRRRFSYGVGTSCWWRRYIIPIHFTSKPIPRTQQPPSTFTSLCCICDACVHVRAHGILQIANSCRCARCSFVLLNDCEMIIIIIIIVHSPDVVCHLFTEYIISCSMCVNMVDVGVAFCAKSQCTAMDRMRLRD